MPTWTPMCKAMQVYGEPFFTALERWRLTGDEDLLRNRLALCETAFEIMNDYYQVQQKIEFDLICENNDIPLEPEKIPTAGKEYIFNGDRLAYNAARTIVPDHIFNRVGLFFQTNLLRGMAGFGDSVLAVCNFYNRHSILAAIEKLFRIANEAGKAHFTKRILFEGESSSTSKFKTHPTVPLSANGAAFATFIMESLTRGKEKETNEKVNNLEKEKFTIVGKKRKEPPASSLPRNEKRNTTAKKAKNNYSKAKYPKKMEDEEEEENDSEPEWTTSHKFVGTKVANYFDLPEGRQLFRGEVVLYAPPSKRGANDQLYHIRWEDSDEEDYDEEQLQTATSIFQEQFSSKDNKRKTTPSQQKSTPNKASTVTSSSSSSSSTPSKEKNINFTIFSASSSPMKEAKHVFDLADNEENGQISHSKSGKQDQEEEPEWTTHHPSVGTKVAAVFVVKRKSWLYHGTVTRYCPPSTPEADDQLYHIQWEDNDEEDYDEDELQRAVEMYAQAFGTNNINDKNKNNSSSSSSSSSSGKKQPTKKHSTNNSMNTEAKTNSILSSREPSSKQVQSEMVSVDYDSSEWSSSANDYPQIIGSRVAVYFPPSGKRKTLFPGVVTKYAKETSSVLHTRDQLYHVVFDDGDVCDLDEDGYQQAIVLHKLYGDNNNNDSNKDGNNAMVNVDSSISSSSTEENVQQEHEIAKDAANHDTAVKEDIANQSVTMQVDEPADEDDSPVIFLSSENEKATEKPVEDLGGELALVGEVAVVSDIAIDTTADHSAAVSMNAVVQDTETHFAPSLTVSEGKLQSLIDIVDKDEQLRLTGVVTDDDSGELSVAGAAAEKQ